MSVPPVTQAAAAERLADGAGEWMHALAAELYPIPRSITGDGVRATLARLGEEIPLELHEVPSGTGVFDWTVPKEWNLHAAWIEGPGGARVVDLADHNLHVVGYSVPVRARLPLAELREHLFSLPDQPELIPYRTAYYSDTWGFCLPHAQLEALPDGDYEVCVDATLEDGQLSYGECVLPGEEEREILISSHVCHPSLANDNLSGIVVATALARALAETPRRHTLRFLFAPGTIGAITWLARNERRTGRIAHGLVLTGVGDPGALTYKRSRRGDAEVDRAGEHVLAHAGGAVEDFSPYGYDERQFCSPGFDLPVGCLMRTPFGRYPQYHTSADDLSLISAEQLEGTLRALLSIVDVLERNASYRSLNPYCEPQLGKRGLYGALGGRSDAQRSQLALLWVLNQSDGSHTLLDIAQLAGLPFELIAWAAATLLAHDLLEQVAGAPAGASGNRVGRPGAPAGFA